MAETHEAFFEEMPVPREFHGWVIVCGKSVWSRQVFARPEDAWQYLANECGLFPRQLRGRFRVVEGKGVTSVTSVQTSHLVMEDK